MSARSSDFARSIQVSTQKARGVSSVKKDSVPDKTDKEKSSANEKLADDSGGEGAPPVSSAKFEYLVCILERGGGKLQLPQLKAAATGRYFKGEKKPAGGVCMVIRKYRKRRNDLSFGNGEQII